MTVMLWLVLFGIFGLCCYWHVHENREFIRRWKRDLDAKSAEEMTRFAWSRTAQLLAALACSIMLILMYDWQLSGLRKDINTLEKFKAETEQKEAKEILPQPPIHINPVELQPTEEPQPIPPPSFSAGGSSPPVATAILPNASSSQSASLPENTNLAKQALQENTSNIQRNIQPNMQLPETPAKQGIADVYNPEAKASDTPSAIDAIKKRYEDILVTHMFLKKCNLANDSDYAVITAALAQEMASTNAPGRLQYDILTSAEGSYNEIYAKSSCEGAKVNALYSQYSDYIKALSKNLQIH